MIIASIVLFMVWLAVGQTRNYYREKNVKEYFRTNNIDHILVCDDVATKEWLTGHDGVKRYERLAIINLADSKTYDQRLVAKQLRQTVQRVGVMQFPCLLTLEENELKGRYFN